MVNGKKRNGKKKTSESVSAEIERLKAYNAGRFERIEDMKKKIKADNAKIRRLETLHGLLNNAELKEQVESAFFKDNNLTSEQIQELIRLGKQMSVKIDVLSTDTKAEKKQNEAGIKPASDSEDGEE
jgi:hypothetical protein